MKSLIAILMFGVVLVACNKPQPVEPAFDLAKARTSIDSMNQKFMDGVAKGDSVGVAALYHSEAILMEPNFDNVSGQANLQAGFGGMFKMGISGITLKTNELFGDEEHLIETGTYDIALGGKSVDKGKYLVVWKPEGGQWKLYRDIFNTSQPITH